MNEGVGIEPFSGVVAAWILPRVYLIQEVAFCVLFRQSARDFLIRPSWTLDAEDVLGMTTRGTKEI